MRIFQKDYAIVGAFTRICALSFQLYNKNFPIERSNYTIEVSLVLHELFVSNTVSKCGHLADFVATSLPTTHEYMYMHAHC